LFWVDEGSSIRFVRYSLVTNTATVLSSIPRASNFDALFLTISAQGDVLLSTSRSSVSRNCVALLSPSSSALTVKWGLASDGILNIAPTLTDQGLFLNLADSTPFGSNAKLVPLTALPTTQPFALGTCL
jgi:hypothetical protein